MRPHCGTGAGARSAPRLRLDQRDLAPNPSVKKGRTRSWGSSRQQYRCSPCPGQAVVRGRGRRVTSSSSAAPRPGSLGSAFHMARFLDPAYPIPACKRANPLRFDFSCAPTTTGEEPFVKYPGLLLAT